MLLDTLIFDASACGFPSPRVPFLPTGLAGLSLKRPAPWAPAANFRHFKRGRYALREAYRLAGIAPGSAILAPAYHCRTMLDPALALGGNVVLYPLQPDLSPDLSTLDALTNNSPTPVKALLATHFFGFPKPLEQLSAWCAQRGITLIEDCSHVLFNEQHCPPGIGRFSEFIVSSPYKFLPSPDGGLLYARQASRLQDVQTQAPPWAGELRGLAGAWSNAAEHRRSHAACDTSRIDLEIAAIAEHRAPVAKDFLELANCSADYRPDQEHLAALRYSRMLYRHGDSGEIAHCRRRNYRRWVAATMNMPYCRPLLPELPEGCIPYMFPLHIEQPEPQFHRLKRLGMPIWRWDSIVTSACAIALDYRLRLFHLPCHQALDEHEMEWMISAVTNVSAGGAAPSVR